MICAACGSAVGSGVNFCPRCGVAVQTARPTASSIPSWMPLTGASAAYPLARTRVGSHLQTLGILWCVYAGYRILHAIFGMIMLHTVLHHFGGWGSMGMPAAHMNWIAPMVPVFGLFTFVAAGLAAFTGYALITRQPWGRTLAIVVAILSLFKPVFGTALGIYTLWALASTSSEMEYTALAERQA